MGSSMPHLTIHMLGRVLSSECITHNWGHQHYSQLSASSLITALLAIHLDPDPDAGIEKTSNHVDNPAGMWKEGCCGYHTFKDGDTWSAWPPRRAPTEETKKPETQGIENRPHGGLKTSECPKGVLNHLIAILSRSWLLYDFLHRCFLWQALQGTKTDLYTYNP